MSPEKFKRLEKLRKKLDKIDNSLLKIIKKRSDIVKKVLQLKSFKKEIGSIPRIFISSLLLIVFLYMSKEK